MVSLYRVAIRSTGYVSSLHWLLRDSIPNYRVCWGGELVDFNAQITFFFKFCTSSTFATCISITLDFSRFFATCISHVYHIYITCISHLYHSAVVYYGYPNFLGIKWTSSFVIVGICFLIEIQKYDKGRHDKNFSMIVWVYVYNQTLAVR